MSWLVALNAAGRFLAAILNVGVVESDLTDGVVRDGEAETFEILPAQRNASEIQGRRCDLRAPTAKCALNPFGLRPAKHSAAGFGSEVEACAWEVRMRRAKGVALVGRSCTYHQSQCLPGYRSLLA